MKFFATLAAGLVAAAALTPIPAANAQRVVAVERGNGWHHGGRHYQHRRWHGGRWSYYNNRRNRCRTVWIRGHRERRCTYSYY